MSILEKMARKCSQMASRNAYHGKVPDRLERPGRRNSASRMLTYAIHWPALAVSLLFALLMPGANSAAVSAAENHPLITEVGWITGYTNTSIPEGHYDALLLIAHVGAEVNRFIPALRHHRGALSFFLEPQFNPVLKPSSSEFGLGIGLQYAYPLTRSISPYFLLVTGPHYLCLDTQTQANGFNFSNAAGIGFYISLNKRIALNLGYRYRHISNADLRQPNGGINSHIGLLGLSFFF